MSIEWEYSANVWSVHRKAEYLIDGYAPEVKACVYVIDNRGDGQYSGYITVNGHLLFVDIFATRDGAMIKLEQRFEMALKGYPRPPKDADEPIDYTKIGRGLYQNGK